MCAGNSVETQLERVYHSSVINISFHKFPLDFITISNEIFFSSHFHSLSDDSTKKKSLYNKIYELYNSHFMSFQFLPYIPK